MRTVANLLALAALLLTLVACGTEAEPGLGAGEGDPAVGNDASDEDGETTITGALGGNAQLEGGCVWVETDDGRYEVLWPQGWQADADPVELRNPDGDVIAREGDEVRVTGAEATDVATTCQVGTVFEAKAVKSG
jgi:hypothetical protein